LINGREVNATADTADTGAEIALSVVSMPCATAHHNIPAVKNLSLQTAQESIPAGLETSNL
jgi:hypothetical protein